MQKANRHQDRWRNTVFFLSGLIIVVVDQLSKTWIRTHLPEGQSLFEVGFFRITHIRNSGASFGLLQDQSFALIIVALIGITAILVYVLVMYRRFPLFDSMPGKLALGLALGGTLGNLLDRLRFGYVTDFIYFSFWPAFNVADPAVIVAVIILAYSLLRLAPAEERPDGQNI